MPNNCNRVCRNVKSHCRESLAIDYPTTQNEAISGFYSPLPERREDGASKTGLTLQGIARRVAHMGRRRTGQGQQSGPGTWKLSKPQRWKRTEAEEGKKKKKARRVRRLEVVRALICATIYGWMCIRKAIKDDVYSQGIDR